MNYLSHIEGTEVQELKKLRLYQVDGTLVPVPTVEGVFWWDSNAASLGGGGKHITYNRAASTPVFVPRLDLVESVAAWHFTTATGTSPFAVDSTTKVTNLNADLLDGYDTSATAVQDKIPLYYTSGRLLVGAPVAGGDAVNKDYADAMGAGLNIAPLGPVHAATTGSIADLSACSVSQDGVTLVEGQYLLVKDGASPDGIAAVSDIYNGSYTVGVVAGGTAPLTRRSDADSTAELDRCYLYVADGLVNQGSSWVQTTNDPVIGTSDIVWTKFFQAVAQNPGNGIDITGNVVSVMVSGSTTYTAGAILYHGTTATITAYTGVGVLQTTAGASPTVATGNQYGVPYWATATTLGTTLAPASAVVVLHGNASGAPTWSAVSLAADVTGTLPVANGGTGAVTLTGILTGTGTTAVTVATGTARGVPYWATTSTFGTTLAPASANVVLHGHASGAPTWSAIDLLNDVTGDLPLTNIAQIATTSLLGRKTAGTGDIEVLTDWAINTSGFLQAAAVSTILTLTGVLTVTGTGGLVLNTAANTSITLSPNGSGWTNIVTATAGNPALRLYGTTDKTSTTVQNPLYITTNEAWASNPFGAEFKVVGGAAIGNRRVSIQTQDVNLTNGGHLILQPSAGSVGILTTAPVFGNGNGLSIGVVNSTIRLNTDGTDWAYMEFVNNGTQKYSMGYRSATDDWRIVAGATLGGVTGIIIDETGKTGFGTDGPTAQVHFLNSGTPVAAVASVNAWFQANTATSTNSRIGIVAGTIGIAGILFGDADSQSQGRIEYDNSGEVMNLYGAGGNCLVILPTAGYVEVISRLCIGANDPAVALDVRGAGTFTGNVTLSGLATASTVLVSDANKVIIAGPAIPSGGTVARVKVVTITGNASDTTFTVTHNLAVGAPSITVWATNDDDPLVATEVVIVDIDFSSTNAVTVTFVAAPADGAKYFVVCVG